MTLLLALLLTFADSTQQLYARRDARALAMVCAEARAGESDLLCRYRLFPLTGDPKYVEALPEELPGGSARALALLSGLWGYRAAQASLPNALRYGLRADRLLDHARALDPEDPYVLLVGGQSLLFRPRLAGRDVGAALERFERLHVAVEGDPHCGISPLEAELWIWYALRSAGDERAAPMRRTLLARSPPPLYRDFLLHPIG